MGEGVRLKNEFLSQNLIQQQSNQSQHPQQRMEAEKLLKETSTSNNIEDNIMDASQQIVLDYLLSSKMGEINNKKIKIGDKTYNFERNKPITDRLKRKFNKIRQTMDYKRYELKEKRDIRWTNLDKNKALTGIQKRYKATITDEQSAFGNYVNSFSISNIKVQGVKALQYLKYQDFKLKPFLQQNRGMKIVLEAFGTYRSKKTGEEIRHTTRSRRYEITNAEDLPKILSQMATDIEIQMDKMELSESGLVIKQIDKLTFNYDKYNPTRGGSFIALPKWVQNKKACINIKNTDNMCFKYSIQCGVHKIYEKDHGCEMYHYKKIQDTLNWNNINFPSSNVDIDPAFMVGSLDSEMILESKNLTAFQLGFRIHSFSASSARYVAVGMFCFFFLSLSLSPVFFDQRFIPSYRSVWLTLQVSAGDGSFSTIQPLFCWGTGEPASKTRTRGVVSVELRLQNHIHQEKMHSFHY